MPSLNPWLDSLAPGSPTSAQWSVELEAGLLLYALVRACKPQNAIEIGTGMGFSTLHVAQALKDNYSPGGLRARRSNSLVNPTTEYARRSKIAGHLWSLERDLEKLDVALTNVRNAELHGFVSLICGDSLEMLPVLMHRLEQVEFVFVDGDHSYEQCRMEVEAVIPYMSLGGYIVIHDAVRRRDPKRGSYYSPSPGRPPSTADYVKEILSDRRFESMVVDTYCNGISFHKVVSR